MLIVTSRWKLLLITLFIDVITAQEDSLRSALNAVDKRQQDLSKSFSYGDLFPGRGLSKPFNWPEDLQYIINGDKIPITENAAFTRALYDYMVDNDAFEEKGKAKFSSPFRERIEEDKERQKEQVAKSIVTRLDSEQKADDEDEYNYIVQELASKYRNSYPEGYDTNEVQKRVFPAEYYTNLGYDSVGLKKRSRYFEPDGPSESLYLLNYTPRDEVFNRLQDYEDVESDPTKEYYNWNKQAQKEKRREPGYRWNMLRKRFPVTKRSSPVFSIADIKVQQQKRSTKSQFAGRTDPKVAQDLSNIFGMAKPPPEDKTKRSLAKKEKKINKEAHKPADKNKPESKAKANNNKDKLNKEVSEVVLQNERPLQVKKKSIDWSDYFGIDRKKKSGNDIDNEWLMERYHKTVALGTNRGYPTVERKRKRTADSDETKIDEIDEKIRNIEDAIVSEALKYTGSREGITDPKVVKDVKEKVASRLAAAYSLERIRQILQGYKDNLEKNAKEKAVSKNEIVTEKRVSVPRKEAVDKNREQEGDNNIKCSQGNEECEEQTYRTPNEVVDQAQWIRGDCPKIQKACNEVAEVLGTYGNVLKSACNIHQSCLLCSENSWFSPTRQCNILFLNKADELCEGDMDCQRVARHSIRYLLDVNRSIASDTQEECDVVCPDNRP